MVVALESDGFFLLFHKVPTDVSDIGSCDSLSSYDPQWQVLCQPCWKRDECREVDYLLERRGGDFLEVFYELIIRVVQRVDVAAQTRDADYVHRDFVGVVLHLHNA